MLWAIIGWLLVSLIILPLVFSQASRPALPPAAALDTLDLSGHTVVLSVDDGYHSVFEYVYPLLRQYGMTMTLAPIVNTITEGGVTYGSRKGFMNRAEIQEMIDSCGIEVASHSLSHPYLTRLDSARAWAEILESKVVLESLFRTEVLTFVYPYGDHNPRVRRTVMRAGYRMGRAVRPGIPDLRHDPYRIPEMELRDSTRLADVIDRIRGRRLTVLLAHRIVPRPAVFTEWRLADFKDLLDWMHRRQVRVATLAELYNEALRQRLTREILDLLDAARDRRLRQLLEHVHVDATRTLHPR